MFCAGKPLGVSLFCGWSKRLLEVPLSLSDTQDEKKLQKKIGSHTVKKLEWCVQITMNERQSTNSAEHQRIVQPKSSINTTYNLDKFRLSFVIVTYSLRNAVFF